MPLAKSTFRAVKTTKTTTIPLAANPIPLCNPEKIQFCDEI